MKWGEQYSLTIPATRAIGDGHSLLVIPSSLAVELVSDQGLENDEHFVRSYRAPVNLRHHLAFHLHRLNKTVTSLSTGSTGPARN